MISPDQLYFYYKPFIVLFFIPSKDHSAEWKIRGFSFLRINQTNLNQIIISIQRKSADIYSMNLKQENLFTYQAADAYQTSVAYFSMEFAIDQSLKIYSGGLGFLAGSHLRSAYELKQNLLGIGMLWKYGYYDQGRDADDRMKPEFIRKDYTFLQDTGIVVTVQVHGAPVHVKAYLLPPDTFVTA